MVESVCLGMPVGLSFGWCGIGGGVEYLVRKGFVEDDDNEEIRKMFEEFEYSEPFPDDVYVRHNNKKYGER